MNRMQCVVGVSYMLLILLFSAGCGENKKRVTPPPPVTNAPAAKSSVETFIDGATGKTALEAGRTTKDKVRKLSAEHNKDLEEVTQ